MKIFYDQEIEYHKLSKESKSSQSPTSESHENTGFLAPSKAMLITMLSAYYVNAFLKHFSSVSHLFSP